MKTLLSILTAMLFIGCATTNKQNEEWALDRQSFAMGVVDAMSSVNYIMSLSGYSKLEYQSFTGLAMQYNVISLDEDEITRAVDALSVIQKNNPTPVSIDGDI